MSILRVMLVSLFALLVNAVPTEKRDTTTTCADATVYFVRGTLEPTHPGILVGPELNAALQSDLGSKTLEFTGVPYPALLTTYIEGGDPDAAATLAEYVTSKASACPDTKIFISGYSQGAQIVHLAAAQLSAEVVPRVTAAITFGDPYEFDPFPSPIIGKVYCNELDLVCGSRGGIPPTTPFHFTYGLDAPDAAAFIASLS